MNIIQDEFATPSFINDNQAFYDRYVEYRVHGYSPRVSFVRVFGQEYWQTPQQGYQRTEAMESTDYYVTKFKQRLTEIKVDDLWNTKMSIHELLGTVRDPMGSGQSRLAAIKELNVLVGITVVDENGKTKAGRSLEDFYRTNAPKATSE